MQTHQATQIKKALRYMKIAKSSDWLTFISMIKGESFREEVIKPLEEISGWNEEDEKQIKELAKKFEEQSRGKSREERKEIMKKMIKIGGGTATAIGIISLAILLISKRKKNAGK